MKIDFTGDKSTSLSLKTGDVLLSRSHPDNVLYVAKGDGHFSRDRLLIVNLANGTSWSITYEQGIKDLTAGNVRHVEATLVVDRG